MQVAKDYVDKLTETFKNCMPEDEDQKNKLYQSIIDQGFSAVDEFCTNEVPSSKQAKFLEKAKEIQFPSLLQVQSRCIAQGGGVETNPW